MIRGEIWWADLGIPFGSEPGFKRPVLILQDDLFNKSRIHTTIVVSITSNLSLFDAPGNVFLEKEESNLPKDGVINVSQVSTLDKQRLIEKTGNISKSTEEKVNGGIRLVLGLN
ncbi:MAG: type II toxin-antitoxin system PemK/MazF family toxin [Spirochaetia bacterium]|jgi:mRNA interferase MazF|nr:type II toxin-antitoxin system PemK/MazF family toxin [Spirochaetia bacterium]